MVKKKEDINNTATLNTVGRHAKCSHTVQSSTPILGCLRKEKKNVCSHNYSTVKRSQVLIHATKWMNLKCIMLSKKR